MQKLVKLLSKGFPSLTIREHEKNQTKKVSALFIKEKDIEKSKEKTKKVFHMIFLGLSTSFMQYGSRAALYPLKLPKDSKVSTFPPSI